MPSKNAKSELTDSDILLEAGTNELEVMIFSLAGHPYGINVAKVREIMVDPALHRLPGMHPSVEGVFLLRGAAVPLVGLRLYLQLPPHTDEELRDPTATRIIVTEFNQRLTAFRVDAVERICRISAEQISPLPEMPEFAEVPLVALVQMEERIVSIVDFEVIVERLGGSRGLRLTGEVPAPPSFDRGAQHIVMAEDSATIRRLIGTALQASGYVNLRLFEDGKKAWDWLRAQGEAGKGALAGRVDLLISDIEMPQLDGLHLCRLIREHPVLKALPVVLFSSLITPDNQQKGIAVGASAQISKPEVARVIAVLDRLLSARP